MVACSNLAEIDPELSAFQYEAAELTRRIADNRSTEIDRSTDELGSKTALVSQSVESETANGGGDNSSDAGSASSFVQNVVSSSWGSLGPGTRGEMESKMGTNSSNARVHTGPTAMRAAESIDAKAFTVGNHIGFNSGADDTLSPEGKHTIAHELAHVQQQAGQTRRMAQRVKEGSGLEVSDPKDPHEQEAEKVARQVVFGVDRIQVDRSTKSGGLKVQRALGSGTLGKLKETLTPDGALEAVKERLQNASPEDVGKVVVTALAGGGATLATGGGAAPALLAAGVAASGEMGKMELESQQQQGSGISKDQLNELANKLASDEDFQKQVTSRFQNQVQMGGSSQGLAQSSQGSQGSQGGAQSSQGP